MHVGTKGTGGVAGDRGGAVGLVLVHVTQTALIKYSPKGSTVKCKSAT